MLDWFVHGLGVRGRLYFSYVLCTTEFGCRLRQLLQCTLLPRNCPRLSVLLFFHQRLVMREVAVFAVLAAVVLDEEIADGFWLLRLL